MIGDKVDETIIAICDHIIYNTKNMSSDTNTAETISALADLVSARAEMINLGL